MCDTGRSYPAVIDTTEKKSATGQAWLRNHTCGPMKCGIQLEGERLPLGNRLNSLFAFSSISGVMIFVPSMNIRSFAFNLREVAGSLGDMGTVAPLLLGYVVICGVDPSGLLVMMGCANIATGLLYRLPMPIEPMKVIAVVAIAQQWSPTLVYAAGFGMGVVWLAIGISGFMDRVSRYTPKAVIRGIQVSLGMVLAYKAVGMVSDSWAIGVVSCFIIVFLRKNRYAPAALILLVLGACVALYTTGGAIPVEVQIHLPRIRLFSLNDGVEAFMKAGVAQIPLTATNAVIATAALIAGYWPERKVSERQLSLNMGVINLICPFFGGMPLCHGAGGLAGQYFFGARTGGANIIEGTIELFLGLCLAGSIALIAGVFPMSIVGTMMFFVGLELISFARDMQRARGKLSFLVTVCVALIGNMAWGFAAGMFVYYAEKHCLRKGNTRT